MKRFDLATAFAEYAEATIACAVAETIDGVSVIIGGPASAESEWRRHQRNRAEAVFEWESGRDAARRAFPGPVYDDDTIAELLAGARG